MDYQELLEELERITEQLQLQIDMMETRLAPLESKSA